MTTATPAKQAPADAVATALVAQPGATAAELAEAAGIARSSAAKALTAMEQQGTACRIPGGRDGGRRLADRWHPASSATEEVSPAEPSLAKEREPGPLEAERAEAAASRLAKGALRSLVLDYLAAHAGPEGLGPTAIAKGLGGRSSGAVRNALARLEADGRARFASESPRRYRTVG
jgi:hypothetical protein